MKTKTKTKADPIVIIKFRLLLLTLFYHRSPPGPISFLKCFSYKDIKKATDGFRRTNNNPSHGSAYKAKFEDGRIALVKEVKAFSEQKDAFYREVQLLGRLHHRHIVALTGFSTGRKRFLVFENIENGSLKEHLNDPLKSPLNWRTRLQIAVGVAAALEYLHFFCEPPMYHVSISSSTIMLDDNFTPKLSDVGLLSSGGTHVILPHESCSDECVGLACGNMIFQLGLLILELVTGQSSEKGDVDLIQWVQESRCPKSIHKMIDPDLGNSYDSKELKGLLAVARLCINSADKPSFLIPQIFRYLQKKMDPSENLFPLPKDNQKLSSPLAIPMDDLNDIFVTDDYSCLEGPWTTSISNSALEPKSTSPSPLMDQRHESSSEDNMPISRLKMRGGITCRMVLR